MTRETARSMGAAPIAFGPPTLLRQRVPLQARPAAGSHGWTVTWTATSVAAEAGAHW